jgi:hypothetical protein
LAAPVAQIAMVKQALVEEERWISPVRFNRLLAVMQILPGPEAHELCVHLGMVARGRIGGLLAGLGFMLPGFALMLGAAWLYTGWIVGNPAMAPIFLGVQVVVLAIILRAVQRIGAHILGGPAALAARGCRACRDAGGGAVLDPADRIGADLYICEAAGRGGGDLCRGSRARRPCVGRARPR